jgi:hypothetical protein
MPMPERNIFRVMIGLTIPADIGKAWHSIIVHLIGHSRRLRGNSSAHRPSAGSAAFCNHQRGDVCVDFTAVFRN